MEFSSTNHLIGAMAAIFSALSWAISALLFAQISQSISAISINWFKGLVAIACLIFFALPISLVDIAANQWLYLGLSGLLGIAVGDTLYFLTLQRLGARLTLLVSTLIPLLAAVVASIIFGEVLSFFAIIGLGITFASVFYVMWSKSERQDTAKNIPLGLSLAMLFVATEASAILLTKAAVIELDSVLVTLIRQVIGTAGLTVWMLSARTLLGNVKSLKGSKQIVRLLLASVIGGAVGTWLSIYALKMTYASVAVILNSISPLFIIPLSIWFLKEKVPRSSRIGAFVAVFGVIIYFLQINYNN